MTNDTNHFHEGDIYRWSWNDAMLKKLDYKSNAGTTYWCCSCIGVVKNGILVDTYWQEGSQYNKTFSRDDAIEKLVLTFVANFSDLTSAQPSDRAYYSDNDCFDLNHANSSRGNFYIRKSAVKNLSKMKRILNRKKLFLERKLKQVAWEIECVEKDISAVTTDSYIHCGEDISLSDTSYQDEPL